MTRRFCPLLRPVVVSLRTGILPASQPTLPNDTVSKVLWMAFMDFRTKRLGMAFTVSGSPVAPSARFLVAVLFLARETSLNGPTAGFCRAPWRSRGSRSNIDHLDELGEA